MKKKKLKPPQVNEQKLEETILKKKRKVEESSPKGIAFAPTPIPDLKLSNIAGIDDVLEEVKELIEWPFLIPGLYSSLGVTPAKGILFYGPTGCGKTMLANCLAGELKTKLKQTRNEDLTYFKISAPELISGLSGESENNIRILFEQAKKSEPCIVFLDEIDSITSKREQASRDMEKRIVSQLISSFNDIDQSQRIVIIGATNRSDALDPSLRSGGRFEREIALSVPDEIGRAKILKVVTENLKISGELNFDEIARRTSGFVGSDLVTLTREAANIAIKRIIISSPNKFPELFKTYDNQNEEDFNEEDFNEEDFNNNQNNLNFNNNHNKNNLNFNNNNNQNNDLTGIFKKKRNTYVQISLEDEEGEEENEDKKQKENQIDLTSPYENFFISLDDFYLAIKKVQPTAKREGFATIPNVNWDDIGSLHEVREELRRNIVEPIREPWRLKSVGFDAPSGVLLYGPPGCGKTLLAKAIANDCGASFIAVKGPELLNKYVGESERAIRGVFERAKHSIPCIIFFDEIDAICPRRDDDNNSATKRVVNQLLTEMDGIDDRKKVFIIGATNRPDIIDPAMLRPPRFDRLLYVSLPSEKGREEILKARSRKSPIDSDVNFKILAKKTERYSGADLDALVREAAINALARTQHEVLSEADVNKIKINACDFELALTKVLPSVSQKDEFHYQSLQSQIRTPNQKNSKN